MEDTLRLPGVDPQEVLEGFGEYSARGPQPVSPDPERDLMRKNDEALMQLEKLMQGVR